MTKRTNTTYLQKTVIHGTCSGSEQLVHGQVTIIFAVSVCLSVCAEFFLSRLWSDFDQTRTRVICLGL